MNEILKTLQKEKEFRGLASQIVLWKVSEDIWEKHIWKNAKKKKKESDGKLRY